MLDYAQQCRRTLRNRAGARDERGQVIVLMVVALVALLGIVGLVIDIGNAYFVQRKLQAAGDAAALAGAAQLPDSTAATGTARRYGSASGSKNPIDGAQVNETVTTKCMSTLPGCDPYNVVAVDEEATVNTHFLSVLGYSTFKIKVHSAACSPCGAKPLDIMIVLDRTGSMCMDHYGNADANCTDLQNAKGGIETFLQLLDPLNDHVGLAVLPPATSIGGRCGTPASYASSGSPYVLVPLANDYMFKGKLNTGSNLVQTLRCVKGSGSTSYATALERAQDELDAHGRGGVTKLILFFSDGAANTGPTYYSSSSPYRMTPCHQGVTSSGNVKAKGTLVYSIGYDLNAMDGGANQCTAYTGAVEKPAITAYQALQAIATGPGQFYNQPTPGDLTTLFSTIAADIGRGSARLINDGLSS